MSEEENKPIKVSFFRLVPQLKIFPKGTVLKTKIDLYYSMKEDVVEVGGEENVASVLSSVGGPSFPQSADFIHRDAKVMVADVVQFRANDNRIYVRAHLVHGEKAVWVNILRVPQRRWGYMIRAEQKSLIKKEIENMFEIFIPGLKTKRKYDTQK